MYFPLRNRIRIFTRPLRKPGITVVLLCMTFLLNAQKYYFDQYGVEEGLSSSKVYAVLQDHMDYLWLGTETGLSRFDGRHFENFTAQEGLAAGGVRSIYQDRQNRIWLGHLNGGLSLYQSGTFEEIILPEAGLESDVSAISETDESLWVVTTADGAFRINKPFTAGEEVSYKQFRGSSGLSDQIFGSYLDRDQNLFFLTDVSIKKYLPGKDRFEKFMVPGLSSYFLPTCMYESSRGEYWFGTHNGGLYRYLPEKDTMLIYDSVRDGLAKNWISCITEDSGGNIWVGTWGGGVSRFTGEGIDHFYQGNGLQASHIQSIIEGREGNILISSQYSGLSIFKGDHFVTISGEDKLPDSNVWAIHADEAGNYYFGTNKGMVKYSPRERPGRKFTTFNRQSHAINERIRFLRKDRNDRLWIGTEGGGIVSFYPREERFVFNAYLNQNLGRSRSINGLEVDGKGNIWVGIPEALVQWNPETEQGQTYTQINGLAGSHITTLYHDSNGYLWIGSEQKRGLTRLNISTGEFRIITLEKDFAPKTIAESPDGRIWVGGPLGVTIVKDTLVAGHLTERDGLLSNSVNLIIAGEDGDIYIGSNNGLNRYNPGTGQMISYTRKNGFTGIETKNSAAYKDPQGRLWFGTAHGVTLFDKGKLRENTTEPLTHIRSMQVNYKEREMIPAMNLKYYEQSIVFDYYSICLTNPDAVRFRVMLENADQDWRPVTTQTRAIYSALSPGKYTFKVKARNSQGLWNSQPVTYSFTIKPPFYLTWWFILACIALTMAGVFVYIQMRERKLRRENRILEEKVQERTVEVVQKSRVIEEKNRDITSSIRYAQRIQKALLPPQDSITNMFVLFKPKDIVSGDFYWLHITEQKLFIAAVDCTGHGVPGAFMSIIGHNSLNKIVKEYGITQPAEILDQLNTEVTYSLSQKTEEEVKDGMDLSLLSIDRQQPAVEFAGAYNPLYHIREDHLEVIKADRFPIGMTPFKQARKFTNHVLDVRKGDMLYVFSDGYVDQFGGENNKKFKTGKLRKLLLEISDLPLQEQKMILDRTLEEWRGNHPQIDDVLLIGYRV